jgi:hypothetical protein
MPCTASSGVLLQPIKNSVEIITKRDFENFTYILCYQEHLILLKEGAITIPEDSFVLKSERSMLFCW